MPGKPRRNRPSGFIRQFPHLVNRGFRPATFSLHKKKRDFVPKFLKDKGYYSTWLRGMAFIATLPIFPLTCPADAY
jgi:hypothetical protein